MMIETRIPFSGFYNSLWSSELDSQETQQVEHYQDEETYPGLTDDAIQEVLMCHNNYQAACVEVAKAYVDRFADWLNEELDLGIKLEYVEMTSPREYNFETDKIFCKVSRDDLAKVYKEVGRKAVAAMARQFFTSRDGFISFYDPDIKTWGPIREWDFNQVYMIFEAARELADTSVEGDIAIYHTMNEEISNAYSNNMDWTSVERDLQHLVDIEEGEAEPDARRFPAATMIDMVTYTKAFEELNSLKQNKPDVDVNGIY